MAFLLPILFFFTSLHRVSSQIFVGDGAMADCNKVCASHGYDCPANVFGSFSCRAAAEAYCRNPYISEQGSINPNDIECYGGGGCFVNCGANNYLELHRSDSHCGVNNCDIGEFSYDILCLCHPKPTPPPEYVIEVTENEKLGIFSLITISCCCVVWLLCCSCSNDVVKRSYHEVATEEELESFVKEELGLQTQALWFLWCEPMKACCWACFQDFKRRIYRCCKRSTPSTTSPQEGDSTHSNPSSSHPLTPSSSSIAPAGDPPIHSIRKPKDEEFQFPALPESPTSLLPSPLRAVLNSSLGTRPSPADSPPLASSSPPPLPQPYAQPQGSKEDPLVTSRNNKTLFLSSSSQRLQPHHPNPNPLNPPSSTGTGLELMRAIPATPGASSFASLNLNPHTNAKSSLSDLYGSRSSKLYGRHPAATDAPPDQN